VVRDDTVAAAVLEHVGGHIGLVGVDEPGDDLVVSVRLGDGVERVSVEKFFMPSA
jgi:hypothetical protein